MKVLFIRPNAGIPLVPPPMGLLYLASCLRKAGDHQAKIIDARLLELSPKETLDEARDFDPDVVGITSLTMEGPAPSLTRLRHYAKNAGRTVPSFWAALIPPAIRKKPAVIPILISVFKAKPS